MAQLVNESTCNAGDTGSIPRSEKKKKKKKYLGQEDLMENEMATHSSIPDWEIPWTEEPGRLQSMGSQELDTI